MNKEEQTRMFEAASPEDLSRLLKGIDYLIDETAKVYNPHNATPNDASIANQELANAKTKTDVLTAYSMGLISLEAAGDHLVAYRELLTEPCKTFAPWTCIRAELESAAVGLWLLDDDCDAKERISRGFALRYDGLVEQAKASREAGDSEGAEQTQARIEVVEAHALKLGYENVRSRRGDRTGIGQVKPSIIELIGTTLDNKVAYRLLSGVAHGQTWALQQVAYEKRDLEHPTWTESKAMIRTVKPSFMMWAGMKGVDAFSRLASQLWHTFGWPRYELVEVLEPAYETMQFHESMKFWRND